MPANILNLSAYTVLSIEENEHDYHIDAGVKADPVPSACPACSSTKLVGFGYGEQRVIKDLPIHAKRVGIYIRPRRMMCRSCNKTFSETLPDMDERRSMTRRLLSWIGKQAVKRTFSSIADEIGVTEGLIRVVFKDYVAEMEKTIRRETPKWMGIDEIYLIKPRGVISNIQNNSVVEILPNRNKDTIIHFLYNLKDKEQIRYVAMDMWAPYRDACIAVIPDAQIIIDKFHVLKMANEAVERVRKGLRERLTIKEKRGLMHDRFVLLKREHALNDKEHLKLSGWIKNYAELGTAYRLKEDFYKIYDAESPDEAQGRYLEWKSRVTPEVAAAFSDLIRAWDNWKDWILGYFEHPVTNAYTESLNNLIRCVDRIGRGYSFEALRAKILFAEGALKYTSSKPKFERQKKPEPAIETFMDMVCTPTHSLERVGYVGYGLPPEIEPARPPKSTEATEKEKCYGADISTLIRLIESGEL
jgi:transposase